MQSMDKLGRYVTVTSALYVPRNSLNGHVTVLNAVCCESAGQRAADVNGQDQNSVDLPFA
jgi:hypothetical protein